MDEANLAEIEARANAAAPWTADECDLRVYPDDGSVYAPQGATLGQTLITLGDTYKGSDADWSFVAHARTDVPALVAEVRRLTAEVEMLRGVGCSEVDGGEMRGPCGACLKCARRERDESRAALAIMRGDLGDTNALADGYVARLRTEHAVVAAAARREGAEGMRAAAVAACEGVAARERTSAYVPETSAKWSVGIADGADVCATYVRAIPLDAPGGGS